LTGSEYSDTEIKQITEDEDTTEFDISEGSKDIGNEK
jgi:hypothetical protein